MYPAECLHRAWYEDFPILWRKASSFCINSTFCGIPALLGSLSTRTFGTWMSICAIKKAIWSCWVGKQFHVEAGLVNAPSAIVLVPSAKLRNDLLLNRSIARRLASTAACENNAESKIMSAVMKFTRRLPGRSCEKDENQKLKKMTHVEGPQIRT